MAARRFAVASLAATLAGAVAIGATVGVVPARAESLSTELVLGLSIGVAYLASVHAVYAVALLHRVGLSAWRAAGSLLRVDAWAFVLSGLLTGIGIGSVGGSTTAGAVAFVCICATAALYALARREKPPPAGLNDEQLLDVVRSAVLMLPASRLPDQL